MGWGAQQCPNTVPSSEKTGPSFALLRHLSGCPMQPLGLPLGGWICPRWLYPLKPLLLLGGKPQPPPLPLLFYLWGPRPCLWPRPHSQPIPCLALLTPLVPSPFAVSQPCVTQTRASLGSLTAGRCFWKDLAEL